MQPAAVFQVVDSLRTGGTERMAVNVSNGLVERGWAVHLYATREGGPLAADVNEDVALHLLQRSRRWDLAGIRAFRRAVIEVKPAVVHCHGWSTLRFVTAAMVAIRRPPTLVLHDHHPRSAPMAWSYRATAWVQTQAHIAVDESLLSPRLRTRRTATRLAIPNGVVLGNFVRKIRYETATQPRIIALANLRPPKGHEVLLRALAKIEGAGITTKTDLVGALSDKSYVTAVRSLCAALGLGQSVTELGLRTDMASRLSEYDVGVVPSLVESGPLVLIEYMASGLPFVTTDTGAIPRLLPPDLRSWVVPVGDSDALARKLQDLLTLKAGERQHIGTRCVEFAQERLSIDRTVDAIESVYYSLI